MTHQLPSGKKTNKFTQILGFYTYYINIIIEERPPIRRVAANKLNKQSRTADDR